MISRLSNAQRLYHAATEAEPARRLRGLPSEIQQRFQEQLEGLQLPHGPKTREKFLDAVAGISENVFGPETRGMLFIDHLLRRATRGAASIDLTDDINLVARRFHFLNEIITRAGKSTKQFSYMRFLRRPSFDLDRFFSSIGIFADGRRVEFEDMPAEKRERGLEILEHLERQTPAALSRISEILMQDFPDSETEDSPKIESYLLLASLFKNPDKALALLRDAHPELFEDEATSEELEKTFQQHSFISAHIMLLKYGIYLYQKDGEIELLPFHKRFEKGELRGYILSDPAFLTREQAHAITLNNSMLLSSNSQESVQHELQHFFDRIAFIGRDEFNSEYRAYLASLVFAQNPDEIYAGMLPTEELFSDFSRKLVEVITGKPLPEPNTQEKVVLSIIGCIGKMPQITLREAALQLFDIAYQEACGLTYNEIVAPFR